MDSRRVDALIGAHRLSGCPFTAGGVTSFVRRQGSGEPVVLMHGLPVSSFLYRKVIPRLAEHGFEAIAFDLPGMGLADRPVDFDYRIRGLGAFAAAAIDALGLDRFHLVVHDAGGPVGFQVAQEQPERIMSLTVLNTVLHLPKAPFPGEVYGRFFPRFRGAAASPWLFRQLMHRVGVADASAVSDEEIDAHRRLLLDADGGAAYLRIMTSLRDAELGPWDDVVDCRFAPYPVDIAWGALDPILPMRRNGLEMLRASHRPWLRTLRARHYLQEDRPEEVASIIAANAHRADQTTLKESA